MNLPNILQGWGSQIFPPKAQFFATFTSKDLYIIFTVKVANIMEIVKIATLTKTYGGNTRSNHAQIQSRNTVEITLLLPQKTYA